MSGSLPRRVAIVSHARARVGGILDGLSDAAGWQLMPAEGRDAAAQFHVRGLLWPFGLHSVFVAEKPRGRVGGAS